VAASIGAFDAESVAAISMISVIGDNYVFHPCESRE